MATSNLKREPELSKPGFSMTKTREAAWTPPRRAPEKHMAKTREAAPWTPPLRAPDI